MGSLELNQGAREFKKLGAVAVPEVHRALLTQLSDYERPSGLIGSPCGLDYPFSRFLDLRRRANAAFNRPLERGGNLIRVALIR